MRYDGTLILGAVVYGDSGLGVLGSEVPSNGEFGGAPMYPFLLAGDMAKEVRWLITSPPVTTTAFFAYEDGSFTATGDGTHSIGWGFYVEGALRSSHTTTFTIGATLGQVTDATTALAVTTIKSVAAGLNTTIETPLSTAASKSITLGFVTDTSIPLPLSAGMASIDQVTDYTIAQAVTASKSITLGIVTDTQFAQAVAYYKAQGVLQAAGGDSALPLSTSKSANLGFATDTTTAQSVSTGSGSTLGMIVDTNQAFSIAASKSITLGIVTDTQFAQAVAYLKSQGVLQATSSDIALPITSSKTTTLGFATNTELTMALVQDAGIGDPPDVIFTVLTEQRIFHS